MAGQGSTIENGATGEVFTFRRTGGETNGESLVVEAVVRPGAAPPAAHAHPAAEERLQVVRGTVGYRIGRTRGVARAGERLTVPPGTRHRFWNAGADEAQFVFELRPAPDADALASTLARSPQRERSRA
ncbi:MAG TPA: cupin domain-containing protein [Gaiellaceae bacterium]|nr:cupin domain-containing protein [Gaiellaceae bacterium]